MSSLLSIEKIKSHSLDMINVEKAVEDVLNYGMLSVRSVNKTLQDASSRPNPRDLYWGLWHEGETGCLFADSGTGKSILAVQMGMEIAETDKVLYIDCELSDKQFQLRYTSEEEELAEFAVVRQLHIKQNTFEPDEDGYEYCKDYLYSSDKILGCAEKVYFNEVEFHSSLAKAAKILNADLTQFFKNLEESYKNI